MPPTPVSDDAPRRLYHEVTVTRDDGWTVRLDGVAPRSPGGHRLVLPTAPLAELVAREWRAQGEHILSASMIGTRLAYGALDAGRGEIERLLADVVRFASADLLCYRAEVPRELVQRQTTTWNTLLGWAEDRLGARFKLASGVTPVAQPPAAIVATRAFAGALDRFGLIGLTAAARLFGSAVLAMALAAGELDGQAAFAASRIDEAFQEEAWGLDPDAAARAEAMLAEARLLDRWFASLAAV